MTLIAATPTLTGLPVEIRRRILEFYFADLWYSPWIEVVVSIDLDRDHKVPRSHVLKCRHVFSPLFSVSRRFSTEVEVMFPLQLNIILRKICGHLNDYDVVTPAMPEAYNALATIPDRLKNIVRRVCIDGMLSTNINQEYQRFPLIDLSPFRELKEVEVEFFDLFFFYTEPMSANWYAGSTWVPFDSAGEKALLEGKPRREIKKALDDAFACFDRYLPLDNTRTFELIFSFNLVYQAFNETEEMSETTVGRSAQRWNHDKRCFIPKKNDFVFDWSAAKSRRYTSKVPVGDLVEVEDSLEDVEGDW